MLSVGPPRVPPRVQGTSGPFVEPFVERMQELTNLGSRISFNGLITDDEAKKFELELRNYHRIPVDSVAGGLGTSPTEGLSVSDAATRLERYGPNSLKPPYQTPMWMRFLLAFIAGFAPLLWFAALFVFLSWEPFGTVRLSNGIE